MANPVVQYVFLRKDLLLDMGWSIGAVVAQACHATTSILYLTRDDEMTMQYLANMDKMHKVVLEVPNEEKLREIAGKLEENSIVYKLWIEQPGDIPTSLAMKPYPKDQVKKYVRKFRLYQETLKSLLPPKTSTTTTTTNTTK